MAIERRAAKIFTAVTNLEADSGPRVAKYAITLDTGALYVWVPDDATTADGLNVLAATGGYAGRWHRVPLGPQKGTDLTNADASIGVAGKRLRVLPAGTLGANRVLTLLAAGASVRDTLRITRLDVGAYTYQIDDDVGSTTLTTLPVSERWFADFYFTGTNWILTAAGQMP